MLQDVGVAHLLARLGGAVVDARVADQRLQQLDRVAGQLLESAVVQLMSMRRAHPPILPAPSRSTANPRLRRKFGAGHANLDANVE